MRGVQSEGRLFDAVFVLTKERPALLRRVLEADALSHERVIVFPSSSSDLGGLRAVDGKKAIQLVECSDWQNEGPYTLGNIASPLPLHSPLWDVASKRTLALRMARERGWQYVMFIDDDISGLSRSLFWLMRIALNGNPIIGTVFTGLADHSFIGHLLRRTTKVERNFIGGGALAINVERVRGKFLNIYNEDWFFILNNIENDAIAVSSVVHAPGASPRLGGKAIWQEVGDVLAEGMRYLKYSKAAAQVDAAFWDEALQARRILLGWLRDGLAGGNRSEQARYEIGELDSLLEIHDLLEGSLFEKLAGEVAHHYGAGS